MTWHTLSDGSLRSACGRWDIFSTPHRPDGFRWVLADAERGTTERFMLATAAQATAQGRAERDEASRPQAK